MPEPDVSAAAVSITEDALICSGRWTVGSIAALRLSMDGMAVPAGETVSVDGAAVTALDSAGAWMLLQLGKRIEAAGGQMTLQSFRPSWLRLVEFIAAEAQDAERVLAPRRKTPLTERVAGIGGDLTGFLAFIGESVLSLLGAVRHPGRVRWQELLDDMWQTGVNALPIVGLLSFLMGVVIAYQGAVQLKLYGANIYIADLVGYSMLRELAPLLTAILICGRTGSAYAAKIGTMQVREEVAALQTIGIPPVDLLVLPKLLSLFVVLPLLTIYADVLAVFGGMFMANAQLGIGYHAFIARLEEAITYSTFMIGVGKAPVFAAIIAIVGCYQGFKVEGSAESVGRHTTISVVQSIFLVIIVDAMFSVLFSMMGV
ncbi:MAG: MlaE family lipid ABC transporter permease subunit [Gammaproteobacteria bacterium]